ncbi:arylsulfatase [Pontiella sulfatireligans]|uniref:arylsulfatase n=1 Tax=Pontiella sulfatireligans TaxID=2750658 RepID=UPI001443D3BF|nr:arylsulfatase [Pontiella sulfatireligans]
MSAAEKPNVIVVLTDDQGYGDFSCHGNPVLKTPNLDKLHAQSIRLTDFHSAPVCTPTRGQLLTGRDAMHNGAWSWAFGHEMIHGENKTMADIFKANGYTTGHFGKWHLGDNYPFRPGDKGFDETISHGGAATHQTPDYWQNDNFDDFYRHKDGSYQQHKGYCTDVWFDLSMDFMARCQKKKKPFFLYLPTNAPHGPHYVAEKYSDLYKDAGKASNFFGMIANIDENMGRLEAFMQENGLAENTILIFMTDNGATAGYEIYNAGMRDKKSKYYDGGHRVPCFIRWPEGNLGVPRDINELTQVQDIFPTLIELLDLKAKTDAVERFDGASLAGLLTGKQVVLADRKLVVQWSSKDYPDYGAAAVLWKKWRLVHDKELYNIADDPAQATDVALQHPEIVESMKAHYADWWETVKPVVSIYSRVGIGGAENPSRLTCFEWTKKSNTKINVTDQRKSVWLGGQVNGSWMLDVVTPGKYRFELMRYPKEAATAMSAAYPAIQREFKPFPKCKALSITRARLQIGMIDKTIAVKTTDKVAMFGVELPAGEIEMRTWLMDEAGEELCGAYYVEATRL